MCFEGMEESGSEGLDDLIEAEKDKFFKGTDAVCISDNYWVSLSKCLVVGVHDGARRDGTPLCALSRRNRRSSLLFLFGPRVRRS